MLCRAEYGGHRLVVGASAAPPERMRWTISGVNFGVRPTLGASARTSVATSDNVGAGSPRIRSTDLKLMLHFSAIAACLAPPSHM